MARGGIMLRYGLAPEVGYDLRPRETVSLEAVSSHYARKPRDKVGSIEVKRPLD
jgi:hypothetical protein